MSGRGSKKNQRFGSSRRGPNGFNKNKEKKKDEDDDGFQQDTGPEDGRNEFHSSADYHSTQFDHPTSSSIDQQTSTLESPPHAGGHKDSLMETELPERKRKMGSTRKSTGRVKSERKLDEMRTTEELDEEYVTQPNTSTTEEQHKEEQSRPMSFPSDLSLQTKSSGLGKEPGTTLEFVVSENEEKDAIHRQEIASHSHEVVSDMPIDETPVHSFAITTESDLLREDSVMFDKPKTFSRQEIPTASTSGQKRRMGSTRRPLGGKNSENVGVQEHSRNMTKNERKAEVMSEEMVQTWDDVARDDPSPHAESSLVLNQSLLAERAELKELDISAGTETMNQSVAFPLVDSEKPLPETSSQQCTPLLSEGFDFKFGSHTEDFDVLNKVLKDTGRYLSDNSYVPDTRKDTNPSYNFRDVNTETKEEVLKQKEELSINDQMSSLLPKQDAQLEELALNDHEASLSQHDIATLHNNCNSSMPQLIVGGSTSFDVPLTNISHDEPTTTNLPHEMSDPVKERREIHTENEQGNNVCNVASVACDTLTDLESIMEEDEDPQILATRENENMSDERGSETENAFEMTDQDDAGDHSVTQIIMDVRDNEKDREIRTETIWISHQKQCEVSGEKEEIYREQVQYSSTVSQTHSSTQDDARKMLENDEVTKETENTAVTDVTSKSEEMFSFEDSAIDTGSHTHQLLMQSPDKEDYDLYENVNEKSEKEGILFSVESENTAFDRGDGRSEGAQGNKEVDAAPVVILDVDTNDRESENPEQSQVLTEEQTDTSSDTNLQVLEVSDNVCTMIDSGLLLHDVEVVNSVEESGISSFIHKDSQYSYKPATYHPESQENTGDAERVAVGGDTDLHLEMRAQNKTFDSTTSEADGTEENIHDASVLVRETVTVESYMTTKLDFLQTSPDAHMETLKVSENAEKEVSGEKDTILKHSDRIIAADHPSPHGEEAHSKSSPTIHRRKMGSTRRPQRGKIGQRKEHDEREIFNLEDEPSTDASTLRSSKDEAKGHEMENSEKNDVGPVERSESTDLQSLCSSDLVPEESTAIGICHVTESQTLTKINEVSQEKAGDLERAAAGEDKDLQLEIDSQNKMFKSTTSEPEGTEENIQDVHVTLVREVEVIGDTVTVESNMTTESDFLQTSPDAHIEALEISENAEKEVSGKTDTISEQSDISIIPADSHREETHSKSSRVIHKRKMGSTRRPLKGNTGRRKDPDEKEILEDKPSPDQSGYTAVSICDISDSQTLRQTHAGSQEYTADAETVPAEQDKDLQLKTDSQNKRFDLTTSEPDQNIQDVSVMLVREVEFFGDTVLVDSNMTTESDLIQNDTSFEAKLEASGNAEHEVLDEADAILKQSDTTIIPENPQIETLQVSENTEKEVSGETDTILKQSGINIIPEDTHGEEAHSKSSPFVHKRKMGSTRRPLRGDKGQRKETVHQDENEPPDNDGMINVEKETISLENNPSPYESTLQISKDEAKEHEMEISEKNDVGPVEGSESTLLQSSFRSDSVSEESTEISICHITESQALTKINEESQENVGDAEKPAVGGYADLHLEIAAQHKTGSTTSEAEGTEENIRDASVLVREVEIIGDMVTVESNMATELDFLQSSPDADKALKSENTEKEVSGERDTILEQSDIRTIPADSHGEEAHSKSSPIVHKRKMGSTRRPLKGKKGQRQEHDEKEIFNSEDESNPDGSTLQCLKDRATGEQEMKICKNDVGLVEGSESALLQSSSSSDLVSVESTAVSICHITESQTLTKMNEDSLLEMLKPAAVERVPADLQLRIDSQNKTFDLTTSEAEGKEEIIQDISVTLVREVEVIGDTVTVESNMTTKSDFLQTPDAHIEALKLSENAEKEVSGGRETILEQSDIRTIPADSHGEEAHSKSSPIIHKRKMGSTRRPLRGNKGQRKEIEHHDENETLDSDRMINVEKETISLENEPRTDESTLHSLKDGAKEQETEKSEKNDVGHVEGSESALLQSSCSSDSVSEESTAISICHILESQTLTKIHVESQENDGDAERVAAEEDADVHLEMKAQNKTVEPTSEPEGTENNIHDASILVREAEVIVDTSNVTTESNFLQNSPDSHKEASKNAERVPAEDDKDLELTIGSQNQTFDLTTSEAEGTEENIQDAHVTLVREVEVIRDTVTVESNMTSESDFLQTSPGAHIEALKVSENDEKEVSGKTDTILVQSDISIIPADSHREETHSKSSPVIHKRKMGSTRRPLRGNKGQRKEIEHHDENETLDSDGTINVEKETVSLENELRTDQSTLQSLKDGAKEQEMEKSEKNDVGHVEGSESALLQSSCSSDSVSEESTAISICHILESQTLTKIHVESREIDGDAERVAAGGDADLHLEITAQNKTVEPTNEPEGTEKNIQDASILVREAEVIGNTGTLESNVTTESDFLQSSPDAHKEASKNAERVAAEEDKDLELTTGSQNQTFDLTTSEAEGTEENIQDVRVTLVRKVEVIEDTVTVESNMTSESDFLQTSPDAHIEALEISENAEKEVSGKTDTILEQSDISIIPADSHREETHSESSPVIHKRKMGSTRRPLRGNTGRRKDHDEKEILEDEPSPDQSAYTAVSICDISDSQTLRQIHAGSQENTGDAETVPVEQDKDLQLKTDSQNKRFDLTTSEPDQNIQDVSVMLVREVEFIGDTVSVDSNMTTKSDLIQSYTSFEAKLEASGNAEHEVLDEADAILKQSDTTIIPEDPQRETLKVFENVEKEVSGETDTILKQSGINIIPEDTHREEAHSKSSPFVHKRKMGSTRRPLRGDKGQRKETEHQDENEPPDNDGMINVEKETISLENNPSPYESTLQISKDEAKEHEIEISEKNDVGPVEGSESTLLQSSFRSDSASEESTAISICHITESQTLTKINEESQENVGDAERAAVGEDADLHLEIAAQHKTGSTTSEAEGTEENIRDASVLVREVEIIGDMVTVESNMTTELHFLQTSPDADKALKSEDTEVSGGRDTILEQSDIRTIPADSHGEEAHSKSSPVVHKRKMGSTRRPLKGKKGQRQEHNEKEIFNLEEEPSSDESRHSRHVVSDISESQTLTTIHAESQENTGDVEIVPAGGDTEPHLDKTFDSTAFEVTEENICETSALVKEVKFIGDTVIVESNMTTESDFIQNDNSSEAKLEPLKLSDSAEHEVLEETDTIPKQSDTTIIPEDTQREETHSELHPIVHKRKMGSTRRPLRGDKGQRKEIKHHDENETHDDEKEIFNLENEPKAGDPRYSAVSDISESQNLTTIHAESQENTGDVEILPAGGDTEPHLDKTFDSTAFEEVTEENKCETSALVKEIKFIGDTVIVESNMTTESDFIQNDSSSEAKLEALKLSDSAKHEVLEETDTIPKQSDTTIIPEDTQREEAHSELHPVVHKRKMGSTRRALRGNEGQRKVGVESKEKNGDSEGLLEDKDSAGAVQELCDDLELKQRSDVSHTQTGPSQDNTGSHALLMEETQIHFSYDDFPPTDVAELLPVSTMSVQKRKMGSTRKRGKRMVNEEEAEEEKKGEDENTIDDGTKSEKKSTLEEGITGSPVLQQLCSSSADKESHDIQDIVSKSDVQTEISKQSDPNSTMNPKLLIESECSSKAGTEMVSDLPLGDVETYLVPKQSVIPKESHRDQSNLNPVVQKRKMGSTRKTLRGNKGQGREVESKKMERDIEGMTQEQDTEPHLTTSARKTESKFDEVVEQNFLVAASNMFPETEVKEVSQNIHDLSEVSEEKELEHTGNDSNSINEATNLYEGTKDTFVLTVSHEDVHHTMSADYLDKHVYGGSEPEQTENTQHVIPTQELKNTQDDVHEISSQKIPATQEKRRKMGSTRRNPRVMHGKNMADHEDTLGMTEDRETKKAEDDLDDMPLALSITQDVSSISTTDLESETLVSATDLKGENDHQNSSEPSEPTVPETPENTLQICANQSETTEKRRKMGSTRKNLREGRTRGKGDGYEDTETADSKISLVREDEGEQTTHDQSENSLLSEIESALNKSSQSTLSCDWELIVKEPNPDDLANAPVLNMPENSEIKSLQPTPSAHSEPNSPGRRRRKMGSTRKNPRQELKAETDDENKEDGEIDENLKTNKQEKKDLERVEASVVHNITENKEYLDVSSAHTSSSQQEESTNTVSQEGTSPSTKRKFGSRRANKGKQGLGRKELEDGDHKPDSTEVEDLAVCDPENQPITHPVSEQRNMEAKNKEAGAGLVSFDQKIKHDRSTGAKQTVNLKNTNAEVVQFNIVMVGNSCVGKTSFVRRFHEGQFTEDYRSTIGVDTFVQTIALPDRIVKLQIWDTAGQERFHSITTQVFRNADGLLLMYEITSSNSFTSVRDWITQAQEKAPDDAIMMLLGNKNDSVERKVQIQEGADLAREYNIHFMECSAATGENVSESMRTLAELLAQRKTQREKHTTLRREPPQKKSGCC
ncbi:hypothetical protein Q8A67_014788 [Cirrhinus molitorella]|uniref:small monomeric GTPase n=1 Tax=Cirrhinus molitorella TaxID=172907 RepID=A0AA88PKB0_9TELE|nr:hypothetical protein Q8A67_014788 [Cirrhinus molitorella]